MKVCAKKPIMVGFKVRPLLGDRADKLCGMTVPTSCCAADKTPCLETNVDYWVSH